MEKSKLVLIPFWNECGVGIEEIVAKLNRIPRTGWVDRGVENPETVLEHTSDLIFLARMFFSKILGLDVMLLVHDWPEIEVGDQRTDSYCPEDHRLSKEEKYKAELEAMKKICSTLGPSGYTFLRLWLEYEKKETYRAWVAYQLDKLQAILKAIEYQKLGQPVVAQEFIDHDGDKIKHPILVQLLSEFKKDLL